MTCGHCRAKVAKALEGVAGVFAVDVDLASGTAAVDASPATTPDALVAAIRGAGYDARLKG